MTTTGRLELVALDAPDIEKLAGFYVELAGWQIDRQEADWITVRTGDGQEIAFQLAPDHVPPSGPHRSTRSSFTSTCWSTGTRPRPSGPSDSAPPGWPTARPGSPWPTRPATRSTCASATARAR
jgi:hypothetical protein